MHLPEAKSGLDERVVFGQALTIIRSHSPKLQVRRPGKPISRWVFLQDFFFDPLPSLRKVHFDTLCFQRPEESLISSEPIRLKVRPNQSSVSTTISLAFSIRNPAL